MVPQEIPRLVQQIVKIEQGRVALVVPGINFRIASNSAMKRSNVMLPRLLQNATYASPHAS